MRKWLVAGLTLVLLVEGWPAQGSPPPPGQGSPKDAGEAFDRASAVFLGEVVKVQRDALGFTSLANVRVEKVWKGCQELGGPRVQVDGTGGPTYPARVFALGQRSIFYVDPGGNVAQPLRTFRADSYLHRVVNLAQAQDDLRYLAQHKPEITCAWR